MSEYPPRIHPHSPSFESRDLKRISEVGTGKSNNGTDLAPDLLENSRAGKTKPACRTGWARPASAILLYPLITIPSIVVPTIQHPLGKLQEKLESKEKPQAELGMWRGSIVHLLYTFFGEMMHSPHRHGIGSWVRMEHLFRCTVLRRLAWGGVKSFGEVKATAWERCLCTLYYVECGGQILGEV